jgi:hypothetical protein
LRLRKGESDKFARRTGGTNKVSKRTLSADQVIVPVAIGPFGEIGDVFMRFWDRSANPTPLVFSKERPSAAESAKRAVSIDTPWNLLGKADNCWREEKGKTPFDGSYLSPLPSCWANQQLGLVCCSQLANHINASFNHLRDDPCGTEYCHKVPSAPVMADSSGLFERVCGCSSPNNPFCLIEESTTINV